MRPVGEWWWLALRACAQDRPARRRWRMSACLSREMSERVLGYLMVVLGWSSEDHRGGHFGGQNAAGQGWPGPVSASVSQRSAWSGPMGRLWGWLMVVMVRRRSTVRFRKGAPQVFKLFRTCSLVFYSPKVALEWHS